MKGIDRRFLVVSLAAAVAAAPLLFLAGDADARKRDGGGGFNVRPRNHTAGVANDRAQSHRDVRDHRGEPPPAFLHRHPLKPPRQQPNPNPRKTPHKVRDHRDGQ
jgi:hypothetical protein